MDDALGGSPDVVVYNASARVRGPLVELDSNAVTQAIAVTACGGFLIAQAAARRMLRAGEGAILFTGASASVKGIRLGALRDGQVRTARPRPKHRPRACSERYSRRPYRDRRRNPEPRSGGAAGRADSLLDPDAIARTYLHLLQQDRSAWTWEVELRPWVERFDAAGAAEQVNGGNG